MRADRGPHRRRRPTRPPGGGVRFWRCANERAQAQGDGGRDRAARALGGGARGDRGARALGAQRGPGDRRRARGARACPTGLAGATAFFQRAEVKDVLAWLRLLVDPGDAGAVVRALARPPIELRSIDIARCVQIAAPAQARHGRRAGRRDRVARSSRPRPASASSASSSCTARPPARSTPRGPTSSCTASSTASGCAASSSSPRRPTSSSGSSRSRASATWPPPTCARAPQATGRDFARYVAAVAEAGPARRRGGGAGEGRHGAVCVLADARRARGASSDHVFVLGLQSARMPGARRRVAEPIPDALLHEELAGRHARRARRPTCAGCCTSR